MGHGQNKNIALLQTINWFTNHEWAKKYYCNGRIFHFQESRCSQQMKLPVLNAFIRAWELYYRWYLAGYEVVGIEDERKLLLDPPSPRPSHVPVEGIWGNVWQVMLSKHGGAISGSHAVMQSWGLQHTSAAWSSLSEGDPRRDVIVLNVRPLCVTQNCHSVTNGNLSNTTHNQLHWCHYLLTSEAWNVLVRSVPLFCDDALKWIALASKTAGCVFQLLKRLKLHLCISLSCIPQSDQMLDWTLQLHNNRSIMLQAAGGCRTFLICNKSLYDPENCKILTAPFVCR